MRYGLSIIAAALLCAILSGLSQRTGVGGVLRLLCGTVLTLCLLRPLARAELPSIEEFGSGIREEAAWAAGEGEELARDALSAVIKEQTEAYILDKAAQLDAVITVEVYLDDGDVPVPVGAVITGQVTAPVKAKLQALLEEQLGIPKEAVEWMG